MLAALDVALWLGGWGLLLLGQPVVTIGLLCLVFGLAMRWLPEKGRLSTNGPAKLQFRFAGWALMGFGVLLIADHIVKATLFALTTDVDLGIFAYLPVLDPKLPIGAAAIFLGLIVLRRAPRETPAAEAAAAGRV